MLHHQMRDWVEAALSISRILGIRGKKKHTFNSSNIIMLLLRETAAIAVREKKGQKFSSTTNMSCTYFTLLSTVAMAAGVWPYMFCTLVLTPALSRNSTVSSWPVSAAQCKEVLPVMLRVLRLAPSNFSQKFLSCSAHLTFIYLFIFASSPTPTREFEAPEPVDRTLPGQET